MGHLLRQQRLGNLTFLYSEVDTAHCMHDHKSDGS